MSEESRGDPWVSDKYGKDEFHLTPKKWLPGEDINKSRPVSSFQKFTGNMFGDSQISATKKTIGNMSGDSQRSPTKKITGNLFGDGQKSPTKKFTGNLFEKKARFFHSDGNSGVSTPRCQAKII